LNPGAKITVKARLAGYIDGKSVDVSGMVGLKSGDTVEKFFKKADAALGLKSRKPFKRSFKQGIIPVVLLNGDRLEPQEDSGRLLADGDEISVILTIAGG